MKRAYVIAVSPAPTFFWNLSAMQIDNAEVPE